MPRLTTKNPFGPAQTRLLQYILSNPNCNANEIWQDNYGDKTSKYVYTLLHENRDYIKKTVSVDRAVATTFQIRVAKLGQVIDIAHWLATGEFKAKYIQVEIPFAQLNLTTGTVNNQVP